MENIISEYQRWKQQGTTIRTQARGAMETKFRELLTEAADIAQEYHADFGVALKPPPSITSFKYKSSTKAKAKVKAKAPAEKPAVAAIAKPAVVKNPKLIALDKKLAVAKKKLEAAKTAGTATRNLEDKIYEIEDEIRLAEAAG